MPFSIEQLGELLQTGSAYLLDLVFPPRCVSCQRNGQWFCDACAQQVQVARLPQACLLCGCELPGDQAGLGSPCPRCLDPLGLVSVAALHTGPLQPAIHALKYEGRVELAPILTRYLHAVTMEAPWLGILAGLDGIVPVPLHRDRLRERGFNQAGLLAAGFAVEADTPVLDNAIVRVHATHSQVGLSREERAVNVLGKFRANTELVNGKSLLLVDDVFTTGATMRECAAALREAGACAVFGLALARPTRA